MVQDRIAAGETTVVSTAAVLRCGKLMEKLPHYNFSWTVSLQEICESLRLEVSSRSHSLEISVWQRLWTCRVTDKYLNLVRIVTIVLLGVMVIEIKHLDLEAPKLPFQIMKLEISQCLNIVLLCRRVLVIPSSG
jgi:hypothetical protein